MIHKFRGDDLMAPSGFGCYDINVSTQPTINPGRPGEVSWVLEGDKTAPTSTCCSNKPAAQGSACAVKEAAGCLHLPLLTPTLYPAGVARTPEVTISVHRGL